MTFRYGLNEMGCILKLIVKFGHAMDSTNAAINWHKNHLSKSISWSVIILGLIKGYNVAVIIKIVKYMKY